MKVKDVPQDPGITEGLQAVSYAVAEDGTYTKVGSSGWDPVNVANKIAWEQIDELVSIALEAIADGKQSPLAYYMAINQMDVALLANYSGLAKWRIKRHLKPKVFAKLKPVLAEKYAAIFKISPAELQQVPDLIQDKMLSCK